MRRIRSTLRERPAFRFTAASLLFLGSIVALQLVVNGTDVRRWDVLFDSAWLTLIAGLWLARGLPERFAAMVERLRNRDAFARDGEAVSHSELSAIEADLDTDAHRFERTWGLAIGGLIGVSYVVAKVAELPGHTTAVGTVALAVFAVCVGTVGGFLGGRVIGRMLCYGSLGRALARRGISFRATPGHVDGAAGLKPLGDFYLHQSLLLAIPVVFLLVWSLLLLAPALSRYAPWRPLYLGMLPIAICLEWAAFGAPLRRAHHAMRRQKTEALVEADSVLGPEIARARRELEQDLEPARRSAVRDRLDQLTASFRELDTMPTWPVDRTLRRRVTLGNIAIVVPLAIQLSTEASKVLSG